MLIRFFLYVLIVYLSMAVFILVNYKRAFEEVYGKNNKNWRRWKVLIKRVTILPVKFFILDWLICLTNYNLLVNNIREAKRRIDREKARI